MASKPETSKNAPPAAQAPAEPVAKKKSKLLYPLLGVLLACATGAGAWVGGLREHPAFAFEKQSADAAATKKKAQSFVTLEPFTVNLQDADRERYLQIAVVLEGNDGHTTDKVKQKLPIIRSQILLLLSSKRSTDLQGVEAKQKLAGEIIARARQSLDSEATDKGIEQVHFSQFIIQ